MFGNRKDNSLDPALEQVGTIIGLGAVLDGPLTTKDSTRIDGTVRGNVTINGALIVGQEGKITGTVSAMNAYIAGEAQDIGMDIFSRGVCLPSDNKMTPEQQERIIEVIKCCFY